MMMTGNSLIATLTEHYRKFKTPHRTLLFVVPMHGSNEFYTVDRVKATPKDTRILLRRVVK